RILSLRPFHAVIAMFNKEEYRSPAYKALRDAVTSIFDRHLSDSGFVLFKKERGGMIHHHYHRPSDYGYDYVSIQFDKYSRPKCTINVEKTTKAGLTYGERHIPAEEADDSAIAIGGQQRGRVHKKFRQCWIFSRQQWYGLSYSKPSEFEAAAAHEVTLMI